MIIEILEGVHKGKFAHDVWPGFDDEQLVKRMLDSRYAHVVTKGELSQLNIWRVEDGRGYWFTFGPFISMATAARGIKP